MMHSFSRLIVSLLGGLVLAFGLDSIFLNLFGRPDPDQAALLFFSTAAFGYLIYSFLESRPESIGSPRIRVTALDRVAITSFVREHLAGLLLAILFFGIYIHIGLKLNRSNFDTVDNFLDADNSSWMARIAAPQGSGLEMRGPHPFAYFIFRPLGSILNLFTHDPALSAILLNTFAGGLCVFLAWVFIKDQTENRRYALLIASMLGLSTAHTFLGSVIETYIFSAAALIGFFVLLQKRKDSMSSLVAASLLAFGITLTNFVQNFIAFAVSRPRLKDLIRFGGLTVSLGVLLSLIHAVWFPSGKLFFVPSDAQAEQEFTSSIFQEPSWRVVGRIVLLIRTVFLYTVVAPQPYVFIKEVGGSFPRFSFYKVVPGIYSYSAYDGLGTLLVFAWILLLLASGIFFLSNLIRTRRADVTLALALCLLFNFLLHLDYGREPFLYSPDWAYALIFFVGLSLAPLAKGRFFQGGWCVFLILLAYNQFQFFRFVFQSIAPFVGQGR